jgi:hypothetical protein
MWGSVLKKMIAKIRFFKLLLLAGHQRLTPIILATWEAEIRRITV